MIEGEPINDGLDSDVFLSYALPGQDMQLRL